jgi:phosphoribosylaminoimidazole-succinocarboxamide synthase
MSESLWQTALPDLPPPKRGKVRDIYDLGTELLIVSCDRISAYDHVLRPGIPDKGKILNQLTNHWFGALSQLVPNHLRPASESDRLQRLVEAHPDQLAGRSVLVTKARVIPFECVARGYLAGSAFRDYSASGAICGVELPTGLVRASRLEEPIFTPTTKAEEGHDEPVDFSTLVEALGAELAGDLRSLTLELYRRGAEAAAGRGLILADTKFEFGQIDGEILLIDEVLTPDSSRYWDAEHWQPGEEPVSFDKQFVRNWLDDQGWDRESPPPPLSAEVVAGTRERYIEAFRRIAGRRPEL